MEEMLGFVERDSSFVFRDLVFQSRATKREMENNAMKKQREKEAEKATQAFHEMWKCLKLCTVFFLRLWGCSERITLRSVQTAAMKYGSLAEQVWVPLRVVLHH